MNKLNKKPIVPKLQNLGQQCDVKQPLSCRQQKSNIFSIMQNQIHTARHKENKPIGFIQIASKSNNTSLSKNKPSIGPTNSAILKAINQNLKPRTHTNHVSPQQIQVTPQKHEDQDLYYQIIKQRTQQKHVYCALHPNKKAKFFIHPNNKVQLCSVCAIQEAYDGKAIIWSIESNEQIPKRLQDDEWTIINNYPPNSDKYRKVEQLQQLLTLAKQLYDTAKSQKDCYLKSGSIGDIMEEILQISKDIVENVSNIIDNLESRPFQLILQKYIAKLMSYEQQLSKKNTESKSPKQVYISFQNKDSFLNPDTLTHQDSLVLRQSENQQYSSDFNDFPIYSHNP